MRWRCVTVLVVAVAALVQAQQCARHTNPAERPEPCTWATTDPSARPLFLNWLIAGCVVSPSSQCTDAENQEAVTEYEGYDGWYNNFARPSQGAVDTALLRLLPPAYRDGAYEPANRSVNPLTVSEQLMSATNGNLSRAGRTAFQVFFGQQVVEEVLDAQGPGCPPEYFNIPIPEGHEYRTTAPNLTVMPLLRTRYDMTTGFSPNNPRQQLNEITPYMDGGLVYGVAKAWADVLRTRHDGTLERGGRLAHHHLQELGENFPGQNVQRLPMANPPPPTNHSEFVQRGATATVDRFFKLGNPRGNENPFLLTFGILWFRWHNKIAKALERLHRDWSDEKIFNEARKWVIATYQSVVMYDWLPKYLRQHPGNYQGYKPTTDPQVSHVFQSAAMRFGHTLVTSGVHLRNRASEGCQTLGFKFLAGQSHSGGVRTCNSFWRSPELFTKDPENFERFLMGLSSQSTEQEDNQIVDDLRGRVFGPLEFSRRDLMAVNIQRGRDHGLPDYNTARRQFGLQPLQSLDVDDFKRVTQSTVPDEILERLRDLYNNDPNKVDIWPGGLLETTEHGPGQLFSTIILDQFQRIRDGDRFWFENENNKLFTTAEINRLKQIKIIDIVASVTDLLPGEDIQNDPFTAVHNRNKVAQSCSTTVNVPRTCHLPSASSPTNCRYLPQVSDANTEACSPPDTYDYFSGSEVSYVLTFTLVLALCFGILAYVVVRSKTKYRLDTSKKFQGIIQTANNTYKAKERIKSFDNRYVVVHLEKERRHIDVKDLADKLLRTVDLRNVQSISVKCLPDHSELVIGVEHHYDLFLKFEDAFYGQKFFSDLDTFCTSLGIQVQREEITNKLTLRKDVTTVYEREKNLAEFCRFVMGKAFGDQSESQATYNLLSTVTGKETTFLSMQITQVELANQLGMLPNSIFVEQLFAQMDTDRSGFITIKEFWDVMVVFARGKPEEKARLIFNIYDLSQTGRISATDLMSIVKSTLGAEGKGRDLDQVVKTMLESVGVKDNQTIGINEFQKIFEDQQDVFHNVNIDLNEAHKKQQKGKGGKKKERGFSLYGHIPVGGFAAEASRKEYEDAREEVGEESENTQESVMMGSLRRKWRVLTNNIRSNMQYVFWICLYTLVMIFVFAERAYYYSVEREHAGLRRIAGYGVTVTRGAASAMMFTYSSLLVTMFRNIFTALRSTALHRLFPFDYMIDFHRYISMWALVWTVVHVVGHAINFYHISTQTPSDLTCLFRDYWRGTHVLPKFHYWCWETITGLTGVVLTVQVALIYTYALFGRQHFFPRFWQTHNTYPIFYFLFILHGSGRLVQPPFFHYFFLGPCVLFVLDKLVSLSRNRIKIDVISATQLPSNVVRLQIRRPPNFSFQSGQWVKIASSEITENEYHPFTLSSAPHEQDLTLHIRALGPWTRKLSETFISPKPGKMLAKQIYMDGPFGEGHQTWWDYEVVVLVAGGIGVTPFSSILKDIAHKLQHSKTLLKTKKVMFLWVTRSQKQWEWMTDILQQVENSDKRNIIRTHIFITQFKDKFDLRTIMLYLAERHFQRVSGTSLFTGLRAITHFSRPNFTAIFSSIKKKYSTASIIGVFTCGSSQLSRSVEQSCQEMNTEEATPLFRHYFENF